MFRVQNALALPGTAAESLARPGPGHASHSPCVPSRAKNTELTFCRQPQLSVCPKRLSMKYAACLNWSISKGKNGILGIPKGDTAHFSCALQRLISLNASSRVWTRGLNDMVSQFLSVLILIQIIQRTCVPFKDCPGTMD